MTRYDQDTLIELAWVLVVAKARALALIERERGQ